MNGQSFQGSINFSRVLEAAKKGNSAFSKGKDGTLYFNATIWLNEEADQYGNIMSVQLNPKKDSPKEDRPYIGNAKAYTPKETPIEVIDLVDEGDLPF